MRKTERVARVSEGGGVSHILHRHVHEQPYFEGGPYLHLGPSYLMIFYVSVSFPLQFLCLEGTQQDVSTPVVHMGCRGRLALASAASA